MSLDSYNMFTPAYKHIAAINPININASFVILWHREHPLAPDLA
jgi:hypothetical protein